MEHWAKMDENSCIFQVNFKNNYSVEHLKTNKTVVFIHRKITVGVSLMSVDFAKFVRVLYLQNTSS